MTRDTGPQRPSLASAWSVPLILVITALKSISTVPLKGYWPGVWESLIFATVLVAILRAIVWPISWLTARPGVVNWLKHVHGIFVVLAWPCATSAIFLLDPDHGILHRYQLPTWPGLFVEWLVILFTPMLTIRWFKVRKSVARAVPSPRETDAQSAPIDATSSELAPIAVWHTRRDFDSPEKGPFDTATILEALKDGSLCARVLIRRQGEARWVALQEHPTFQSGAPPVAPEARSAAFDDALKRMRSAEEEAGDGSSTSSTGSSPSPWKRVARLTAGVCSCLALVFGSVVFARQRPSPTVALSPVPWQYHSPDHSFSLTFPSASWKLGNNSGGRVSFRGERADVVLRVEITAVEPRTREEFAAGKEKFKSLAVANNEIVGKTVFSEGVTHVRDPYVLGHCVTRVAPVAYGAVALVWLRARGLLVQLTFDAQRTNTRNLDHSEFEREAESILLSLEDDTKHSELDQAPTASAARTQASALPSAESKALPTAAPPQFTFDWSPPCRIRVVDLAAFKEHVTRMLYTIVVSADGHDQLQIRREGFAMLQIDGVDVTGREWQERLKQLVEMAATTPAVEVSRAGRFQRVVGGSNNQRLVELMIAENKPSPDMARNLRTLMASPAMAEAMQGELADEWSTWVEAWLGWTLAPGATRDEVSRAPSGLPAKVRREFFGMNDGVASLRKTITMTGADVGRSASLYAADLVRGIWPGEFPKNVIKHARIVETASAEIRPETLRPRHTHWLKHTELEFSDGTERTNEQSHDLEWDWEHSSGCSSAARP